MPTTTQRGNRRLNTEVSAVLHKRIKLAAVEHDKTMGAMIEQILSTTFKTTPLARESGAHEYPREAMDAVTRARQYGGPCTMLGAQIPRDLVQAIRDYCTVRNIVMRHFITDALRRHLRMVRRGDPVEPSRPARRIRLETPHLEEASHAD